MNQAQYGSFRIYNHLLNYIFIKTFYLCNLFRMSSIVFYAHKKD